MFYFPASMISLLRTGSDDDKDSLMSEIKVEQCNTYLYQACFLSYCVRIFLPLANSKALTRSSDTGHSESHRESIRAGFKEKCMTSHQKKGCVFPTSSRKDLLSSKLSLWKKAQQLFARNRCLPCYYNHMVIYSTLCLTR